MSLGRASIRGSGLGLRGPGPWPGTALGAIVGQKFHLPSEDPWLREAQGVERAYLEGSREAWIDHPEHMDFLDPSSPVHKLKSLQRDLCLSVWETGDPVERVLDIGAGIGRFTQPFLDRGVEVWAVDPDLDSLRRLVWHAAGRPGKLDVVRSGTHHLPEITADLAILAEVLCYVPDAAGALKIAASRVRSGGALWISVEARWGWALAPDAPAGGFDTALEGGVVDLPGRWVRTYDDRAVRSLVEGAGLQLERLVPSHYTFDGPFENLLPPDPDLDLLLRAEARCRKHPVFAPLHRLWLAVARKP